MCALPEAGHYVRCLRPPWLCDPLFKAQRSAAPMSFRPRTQNKISHLTMDDVRGIMQAKDDAKAAQTLADQQLVEELKKRGFRVDK